MTDGVGEAVGTGLGVAEGNRVGVRVVARVGESAASSVAPGFAGIVAVAGRVAVTTIAVCVGGSVVGVGTGVAHDESNSAIKTIRLQYFNIRFTCQRICARVYHSGAKPQVFDTGIDVR